MPRKKRNTQGASANENWIKTDTLDSYKRKALQLVEQRNEYESKRKFTTVRVDHRTIKLVEIKN